MRRFVLFLEVGAIVALMLALPTPALAQTAPAETPSPTAYTDSVQGIEFSEGTVVDDTRFGASFAGEASGELPGYLVATTDYTPPSPGPDVTNNIVGGGWTLLGERGTILGSFTGGAVRWNTDGTLAEVVADMSVLGGSVDGTTIPSRGTGTFSGMLDHTPLSQGLPPTINGTLQVTLYLAAFTENPREVLLGYQASGIRGIHSHRFTVLGRRKRSCSPSAKGDECKTRAGLAL